MGEVTQIGFAVFDITDATVAAAKVVKSDQIIRVINPDMIFYTNIRRPLLNKLALKLDINLGSLSKRPDHNVGIEFSGLRFNCERIIVEVNLFDFLF
jgi:hypothetical protein